MNNQRGLTILGLFSVLLVLTFFAAIVGGIVYAFYWAHQETGMEGDVRRVQSAVDAYATASFEDTGTYMWPTADGELPKPGQDTAIDFYASFQGKAGGKRSFYPDFLPDLPRHYSSGVWRIDSKGDVSVNLERGEY
jgi:hypothetical protein